ncbi:MAG: hypothetical protein ABEJ67_05965 [Halanaeroarchaeum sp.]
MYAPTATDHRVEADVQVQVPRDLDGTLADGLRTVLARVDGVESVETADIHGLTPRLNDMQVEARVTLVVTVGDVDAVEDRLAEGFGVDVVALHRTTPVEDGREAPRVEYG